MTDAALADAPAVTLSDRAAKRVSRILSKEAPGTVLRISVAGGGCSGFQYGFALEGSRNDDDVVFESEGGTLVIDAVSYPFLAGAEIDYVEELIGASFQIKNPNASASCSCGTSFAVG